MTTTSIILIVVTVAVGLLRVLGVTNKFYKSPAHIYVGGLLGAALVSGVSLYWWLFAGLTTLEVVCFLVFRAWAPAGQVTTQATRTVR